MQTRNQEPHTHIKMKKDEEAEPNRIIIALVISIGLNAFLLSSLLSGWKLAGAMILFVAVMLITITKTRKKKW